MGRRAPSAVAPPASGQAQGILVSRQAAWMAGQRQGKVAAGARFLLSPFPFPGRPLARGAADGRTGDVGGETSVECSVFFLYRGVGLLLGHA